jgi:hypothetical protein
MIGCVRKPAIFASLTGCLLFAKAGPLHLPTPNESVLHSGEETRFYAPTPGRDWVSGTYG